MKDRVKPLKGVMNFRDFGGYSGDDGAIVKPGLLFRTGSLHRADDSDIDFLNTLNIDFQVDLRRQAERAHEPNKWAPHEVHTYNDTTGIAGAHIEFMKNGQLTADSSRQFMVDYYARAPWVDSHVDLYQRWFRRLAETDGAGMINCAAGKDRTGIGCALTLTLVGVDDDTVMQDYLLTNTAVNLEERLPKARAKWEERLGIKLDNDEVVHPFLGVKEEYLHKAYATIREKHGSIEGYAEEVLGVDESRRQQLKDKLLG